MYSFVRKYGPAILESPKPALPSCQICAEFPPRPNLLRLDPLRSMRELATGCADAVLPQWDGTWKRSGNCLYTAGLSGSPQGRLGTWTVSNARLDAIGTPGLEVWRDPEPYWRLRLDVQCGVSGLFRTAWCGRKTQGTDATGIYTRDPSLATFPLLAGTQSINFVLMINEDPP